MLQDFRDRGFQLTEDEYRSGIRALFPEAYQDYHDEELEDILYDRIAGMSPSEAEGFFSSVGHFLKNTVAPIAISALPAVASIAGTFVGGPLGAAAGGALGSMASKAIGGAAHIRPNPIGSSIGQAATAIAGGNIQNAIPSIINAGRTIGNQISPGAGNTFAGIASSVAQAGTAIAGGNYQAAIPNIINAGRQAGNAVSPGAGNRVAGMASGIAGQVLQGAGSPGQSPPASQLLSFINSTPFLQTLLSSIATGSQGTGLQIPTEDGGSVNSSYLEMLESLKYLTENAIIDADASGYTSGLAIESEADRDSYIEELIGNVTAYENSLLPNYDTISYN